MDQKTPSFVIPTQSDFHAAARRYHAAGHNVIWWRNDPDTKRQFPKWRQYQDTRQSSEELSALLQRGEFDRLAIICTDGMECIDIDVKADPTGRVGDDFWQFCREDADATDTLKKCCIVKTKSGGWHIVYRANNVQPNQKLAHRAGCKEALIETRGTGGLIFVAPSPGYEVKRGGYDALQTITDAERDHLIGIARLLNEPDTEQAAPVSTTPANGKKSPWDEYDEQHTVEELAQQYGYTIVNRSGDKLYLNRPGAKNPKGVDAVILTTRAGNRRFYVHSTSTVYQQRTLYSPFGMYAVEAHNGDIQAATAAIAATLKPVEVEKEDKKTDTEEKREFVGCHSLIEEDERYYWRAPIRGQVQEIEISNFLITPLYHLKHPEMPKRVFSAKNIYGDECTICALVKELAGCEPFKAIIEGKGNFVASFNARQYSAIKEHWFFNEQEAIEVNALGYIGDGLYAFANGIFDGNDFQPVNEFGIVEAGGKRWFIPAYSSIYGDNPGMWTHERKMIHNAESTVTFEQWSALFCRAFSENDNGRVGVVFACASLFRTLISGHTNFFPLLFLFGMPKTGKSTFRDAILHLWGTPMEAIGLGNSNTAKGYSRRLAQRTDAVQVFEEYKNTIPPQLIEMLKNVYDLIGYERSQTSNDNRTHHTSVLSSVIVAGQELPVKENALFSRTITTEFVSNQFTKDQVAAYTTMTDMQKNGGVTAVTLDILRQRPHMEAEFVATYREMRTWLKEHKAPDNLTADEQEVDPRLPNNIDDRSINNTAVLLATYRILSRHLKFPFSMAQLIDSITAKLKSQIEIMNDSTEIKQFWRAFDVLCSQGKLLDGRDYKREERGTEKWIFISMTTVFPAYYEHQGRISAGALDESTLTRYLKQQPEFRPDKNARPTHQTWLGGKNQRCFAFSI